MKDTKPSTLGALNKDSAATIIRLLQQFPSITYERQKGAYIFHGAYPYVTSRDTTVSGCLSEAGISPTRVGKAIMVCRTYPIRVQNPPGGTSGPLRRELTWEEIARRAEVPIEEIKTNERTSTTNRERRVGSFDWVLLRKHSALNAPTDIAITFTDYLNPANADARRYEQLSPDTIRFIEEVERVAFAVTESDLSCG